jgi:flagellar basal body-associated protein FliL
MPMADEEVQEGNKTKLPIKLIAIVSLIGMVLIGGTVMGTLFIAGYFDQTDSEEVLAEGDGSAASMGDDEAENAGPALLETPNPSRLDTLYHRFETPFTANVSQSRMVMQLSISLMTHYDEIVINNVVGNVDAVRAAINEALSETTEAEVMAPNFRQLLEERIRIRINAVLERLADFGGIESVLFTEFLVQ